MYARHPTSPVCNIYVYVSCSCDVPCWKNGKPMSESACVLNIDEHERTEQKEDRIEEERKEE